MAIHPSAGGGQLVGGDGFVAEHAGRRRREFAEAAYVFGEDVVAFDCVRRGI